jgi:glucose/arabinose dehydrogenase
MCRKGRAALAIFILALFLGGCAPAARPPQEPPPGTVPPKTPGDVPGEDPANGRPPFKYPAAGEVENRFTAVDAFPGITFSRPLDLQHAGDGSGSIYVVEKRGVIYRLSGPQFSRRETFLDIRSLVDDRASEMGLLGLAFHPDFAGNGYFYVNYTDARNTVIARFTAAGDRADPDSGQIILSFSQPLRNHNGGQVAFGPDGYLYIATGDGGGGGDPQGHGQDRRTFHGNILRIDVDRTESSRNYGIPPDNPFTANREGYLEEIYAYGLRNPWRFSFDSENGLLWAADVGQNQVEEINIIEKGKNYGWNIMEGSLCFNPPQNCDPTGLELPVFEYRHPLGRSITGGYVYRGKELPRLTGAYIYADYVSGLIWGLWYREGHAPINYLLADTGLAISSFGLDEEGELYLTAFDGKVYRLELR